MERDLWPGLLFRQRFRPAGKLNKPHPNGDDHKDCEVADVQRKRGLRVHELDKPEEEREHARGRDLIDSEVWNGLRKNGRPEKGQDGPKK